MSRTNILENSSLESAAGLLFLAHVLFGANARESRLESAAVIPSGFSHQPSAVDLGDVDLAKIGSHRLDCEVIDAIIVFGGIGLSVAKLDVLLPHWNDVQPNEAT